MVPGFDVSAECQSIGTSDKKQRACYLAPKILSWCIFELSFLGCGFLIHLSNRSDSPRFRAPWKKIRQKYGTRHEPSLFKGHPLSRQYGAYFELSFLGCGFLIHLSNRSDSPRFLLKSMYEITDCAKNQIFPSRDWADQEVEGLLFSPRNSQLVHIFSFCSQGVVS